VLRQLTLVDGLSLRRMYCLCSCIKLDLKQAYTHEQLLSVLWSHNPIYNQTDRTALLSDNPSWLGMRMGAPRAAVNPCAVKRMAEARLARRKQRIRIACALSAS
jgi:hypothetical protein